MDETGEVLARKNSASITEARQRVGCRVMSQLFERIVRPLATPETPGAFLGGLRVMAVDGTVLDVPESFALFQSLWISRQPPRNSSRIPQSPVGDVGGSRDTSDRRCIDVSLSHWRTGESRKNCCAR